MSAWPRASVTRARVAKLGPYGRAGWFASLTVYDSNPRKRWL